MKQPAFGMVFLLMLLLAAVGGSAEDDASSLQVLHPALRPAVVEAMSGTESRVSLQSYFDPRSVDVVEGSHPSTARLSVLVKLDRSFSGNAYADIPVQGSTGSILAMEVTTTELVALMTDPAVRYIEPAWRLAPHLDQSVPATGADLVHAMSPAILGDGAVVGIVDTGIDYTHLDFRYDDDGDGIEESSRILSIWDQTFGLFGMKYSRAEIESDLALGYGPEAGTVRQSDDDGHGTHVMSISAGDGSSSTSGFIGVAPRAWLVAVKTEFYTSDILSGVEHIFDIAEAYGLPAVVNLSLGGHDGPHDGTSLFEEGLDELVDRPGRAIVVSAGNEGDLAVHAGGVLNGNSISYLIDPSDSYVDLSIWYPGDSRFTVSITPPGESTVAVPWGTETGHLPTGAGSVRVDNAWAGTNPNNGDNEAYVQLSGIVGSGNWELAISDESGGGRFDLWITTATGTVIGGDSTRTIDEPGNADRVITVGAFTTKAMWSSQSGDQNYLGEYPIGAIAPFSSRGPTRDGRVKPDLAAPGAWICAALSEDAPWVSTFVHPDGVHIVEAGTSMAAPHVAGTVALMFSVDPELTTDELRTLLTTTATRDGFTGSVPNPQWGFGKLAAAAAVQRVVQSGPQPPPEAEIPVIMAVANPVDSSAQFTFSVPEGTTTAVLRIFDLAGAPVYEAAVDPAARSVSWNLRTNRGEALASGLYLFVLWTDRGVSKIGRLVIAR